VLLLIILAAGLKPEGFRPGNKVSWIQDQPGIRFNGFGIAVTNPFRDSILANISDTDCFSLEIALKPASYHRSRFKFILALHNGEDSEQLVMGQWDSSFILMNDDDYSYRRKIKRITVDVADANFTSPAARFVTVTSGKEGTRLYLDGELVHTKKDLTLKMPSGVNTRFLLGNSVYGRHPWRGDLYGLALYNYQLSSQRAALHFNQWSKNQNFSFARGDNPFLLYLFDEGAGTTVLDRTGGSHHLEIPSRMQVFKRRILALPSKDFSFDRNIIKDIMINIFGFIPFGFVLFATLSRLDGAFKKHGVLITVVFCFSVSFSIEILQVWILSRSSHMLDLLLNTFGAWVGAISFRFVRKAIRLRI
jgi:VanZ family protein